MAEPTTVRPVWIVFDERAILGDTDDAAVLESFGAPDVTTDERAIRNAKRDWRGHNFALYRYDLNAKNEAENGRMIYVGTIKDN
jgi:hypothetical protein